MTGFGGDPRQDEAKLFGLVGILEKPTSPQFLEDYLAILFEENLVV